MIALRLSKAGYGTPQEVLRMNALLVLSALEYEKFQNEYEAAFYDLNKPKGD